VPHALPPLPYPYDALSPTIDELTMRMHHDHHHRGYVANLNSALDGTPLADRPLDQVLANLDLVPQDRRSAVRDNGGGHANHSLLWEVMHPFGGGRPTGALARAIEDEFGSVADLELAVVAAGLARCGSGWVWLVHDGRGLAVVSTPNQDSPLMNGQEPLLGVDIWEHAYYLKYQHRRDDYLEAWWNVVDWDRVGHRYAAAAARRSQQLRFADDWGSREWLLR
jgi:Fe-Mn family superoxide dismutase